VPPDEAHERGHLARDGAGQGHDEVEGAAAVAVAQHVGPSVVMRQSWAIRPPRKRKSAPWCRRRPKPGCTVLP